MSEREIPPPEFQDDLWPDPVDKDINSNDINVNINRGGSDNPFMRRYPQYHEPRRAWKMSYEPTMKPLPGDTWIKRLWRPFLGWQYIAVCLFDFIVAPSVTMLFFIGNEQSYVQWVPLTLQGGAFYHIAMGVALGVTSYGRSQEKLHGIER